MTVTVACVQLNSQDDLTANAERIDALVGEAVGRGATFVALPENAYYMDAPGKPRPMHPQEEHPAVKVAVLMAQKHRCDLLVGSVAVTIDESGKTVNRSLLIDARGNITAHYDKLHLFDVEVGDGQKYAESERNLPGSLAVIADTLWGKLGLTVCYDVRFPVLYRTLAKAGAEAIAVPSAFTYVTGEAHWHVLLRARAIENACYIIAPAQCGTHPGGRKTYGHSMIVGPWGNILAEAGEEPGIILAELDMEQVKKIRGTLPSLKHDRAFTLKPLA